MLFKNLSRAWHDRNATARGRSYSAGAVAPHGSTTRWTYTVPSSKKCLLESAWCLVMRDGAAAPAGRARSLVYVDTGDGTSEVGEPQILTNGVGDQQSALVAGQMTLNAGGIVAAVTEDSSTGGTVRFMATAKLTEYDA